MSKLLKLALPTDKADAITSMLEDTAASAGTDDVGRLAADVRNAWAEAVADAKATDETRLQTWMNTRHSHAASLTLVTSPDGDDRETTLEAVIDPSLSMWQVRDVVNALRDRATALITGTLR